jgi:phospholipid transport system transporter-binding protein
MKSFGKEVFVEVQAGSYQIVAPLTFASVVSLRTPGLTIIKEATGGLTFDLRAVPTVDSAGLALLIDWLAEARSASRSLRYEQLPPALLALAELSDVEKLLVA